MTVPARALLAGEIVWHHTRIRLALRRTSLPEVLQGLRRIRPARRRAPGSNDPARLARAVVRTLDTLPLDSRCLMRSLVLLAMLARRGVAGSLVIAARPEARDRLDAHAWVEVDGRALLAPAGMQDIRLVTL